MIVVDSSALMAYLLDEPEGAACEAVFESGQHLLISAGTLAEALIVARPRGIAHEVRRMVDRNGIEVVPVTAVTADRMADAYARWGKGNHPAGLNLGDCFAYALAEEVGAPILFVGQDFARTDAQSALF